MRIKTSELEGVALDWAVARCVEWEDYDDESGLPYVELDSSHMRRRLALYSPSTDWSQGGRLIEREHIDVVTECKSSAGCEAKWQAELEGLTADDKDYQYGLAHGPTPLIAAMRAFVASKLGEEVEIPEELK